MQQQLNTSGGSDIKITGNKRLRKFTHTSQMDIESKYGIRENSPKKLYKRELGEPNSDNNINIVTNTSTSTTATITSTVDNQERSSRSLSTVEWNCRKLKSNESSFYGCNGQMANIIKDIENIRKKWDKIIANKVGHFSHPSFYQWELLVYLDELASITLAEIARKIDHLIYQAQLQRPKRGHDKNVSGLASAAAAVPTGGNKLIQPITGGLVNQYFTKRHYSSSYTNIDMRMFAAMFASTGDEFNLKLFNRNVKWLCSVFESHDFEMDPEVIYKIHLIRVKIIDITELLSSSVFKVTNNLKKMSETISSLCDSCTELQMHLSQNQYIKYRAIVSRPLVPLNLEDEYQKRKCGHYEYGLICFTRGKSLLKPIVPSPNLLYKNVTKIYSTQKGTGLQTLSEHLFCIRLPKLAAGEVLLMYVGDENSVIDSRLPHCSISNSNALFLSSMNDRIITKQEDVSYPFIGLSNCFTETLVGDIVKNNDTCINSYGKSTSINRDVNTSSNNSKTVNNRWIIFDTSNVPICQRFDVNGNTTLSVIVQLIDHNTTFDMFSNENSNRKTLRWRGSNYTMKSNDDICVTSPTNGSANAKKMDCDIFKLPLQSFSFYIAHEVQASEICDWFDAFNESLTTL